MKLLLVEDNPADARLVREMLLDVGVPDVDLLHVRRLSDALERLGDHEFDAVLLDLGLPDARGLEGLAPVLQAAPDVPVVVFSGLLDETLAMEAVQNGAQDYLLKGQGDGKLLIRSLRYAIERKKAQLEIHHLANHDGLTGLPNRRLLLDRLGQALARTRREKKVLALLFLDIDQFKSINDSLGHGAGDLLLMGVSARLAACVRKCDTVARLGGDEFTVVLPEAASVEDVNRFAIKILAALQAPFGLGAREEHITASMGISLYPNDAETVDGLLRTADAAMYRAKHQGGNTHQFYSRGPEYDGSEKDALRDGLRHALAKDELVLHYQPRVDSATGRVAGVESLLRWRHPVLGLLPPARFVPLAEEMGLIVPIGEWVLGKACAQGNAWRRAGHDLRISVNLSSRELAHPGLEATVTRALTVSGLPAANLELELTEGGLMQEETRAIASLQRLSDLGVRLTIDDFGTGYSSLSRLKRFPIDALKIDRSFVREISHDTCDAAIVTSIITMAHGLDLAVVAEGVESKEQVDVLREQGCDEMQGFYFAAPRPAAGVDELLAEPVRSNVG